MRKVSIEKNVLTHADGSCLIKLGNTHVICAASLDENPPRFLKGKKSGWVTAEYGMLPRSTGQRMQREATRGGQGGRTQEIQRLIGRSLRSVVDLRALGERKQIIIDCDVINADGSTRTAAITGGCVALHLAVSSLIERKIIKNANILKSLVAAVSCGIYKGEAIVDLDYLEDSSAQVDANFVFNAGGRLIEVQATAEDRDFTPEQLMEMLGLAKEATMELFQLQEKVLS